MSPEERSGVEDSKSYLYVELSLGYLCHDICVK